MKPILPLSAGLLATALAAPFAQAEDWSLTSQFSQGFEADTNRSLDANSERVLLESDTRLGLELGVRTKRTDWTFGAGVNGVFLAGPGAQGRSNRIDPDFGIDMTHRGKDYRVEANFGVDIESSSGAQFEDSGDTSQDTGQVSADFGLEISQDLDARNTAGIRTALDVVMFSDQSSGLADTAEGEAVLFWSHKLSRRTTTGVSVGFRGILIGEDGEEESRTLDIQGQLSRQFTRRLSADLSIGVTTVSVKGGTGQGGDNVSHGLSGDLEVKYKAADFSIGLTAGQSVEPSSIGELQNRSELGFDYEHEINSVSRFGFSTSYVLQQSASGFEANGTDRQSIEIEPSYFLNLDRDWEMQVGYGYRLNDEQSGVVDSHRVFLEFSRDFALLP